MRFIESTRLKQTATLTAPRVLISYYRATMTQQEYLLVRRLVTDLGSAGVDVVIDEINDLATGVSPQEIQQCQWVLLVRTADAEHSAQVEARMDSALGVPELQQLRGVLHVLISPARLQTAISDSTTHSTFDACRDYPRALARIVLTLNPDYQVSLDGVKLGAAPPPVKHAKMLSLSGARNAMHHYRQFESKLGKPRVWLIRLTTLLIPCIIVASFLIGTLYKTTANRDAGKATILSHPAISTPQMTYTQATTATSTPQMIYTQATSGTPVIDDPLQVQSANYWTVFTSIRGACVFDGEGAYLVRAMRLPKGYERTVCLAGVPTFGNLALQVDMKLIQGSAGGIVFRAQGQKMYYWFSLDSTGCYELVFSSSSTNPQILSPRSGNCLHLNMQDMKQLTVVAQGNNIYLYIDEQFIYHARVVNLTAGQIGVVCIDRPGNPAQATEAAFMDVKVWQLRHKLPRRPSWT